MNYGIYNIAVSMFHPQKISIKILQLTLKKEIPMIAYLGYCDYVIVTDNLPALLDRQRKRFFAPSQELITTMIPKTSKITFLFIVPLNNLF